MVDVDLEGQDDAAGQDVAQMDAYTHAYEPVLPQLLPQGWAWNFLSGGPMARLYEGLTREFSRVERRAVQLIEESDPRTAQETLAEWEQEFNVPGPCSTGAETIEGRRAAVHAKMLAGPVESLNFMRFCADSLGYPGAVFGGYGRGFLCGQSTCGEPLNGYHGGWTHTWTVTLPNTQGPETDANLICSMRAVAQAHVTIHFTFPGEPTIVSPPEPT